MALLIIKSNIAHVTEVLIRDVGIIVPSTGGSVTLDDPDSTFEASQSFNLVEFCQDDLYGVGSSTLILNDGTVDIAQDLVDEFLETFFVSNEGPYSLARRDDAGDLNIPAEDVSYDNIASGLTATDVQAALDEVAASGFDEAAHEELDTLAHNLVETNFSEIIYDVNNRIEQIIHWVNNTKTIKIREVFQSYVGLSQRVSSLTSIQYDAAGVSLYSVTTTYTYVGLRIVSAETVRT